MIRSIVALALCIILVISPSCRKIDERTSESSVTQEDTSNGDDKANTGNGEAGIGNSESGTGNGESGTGDQPIAGGVEPDESLFTDVAAWTGPVAKDASLDQVQSDASIYWESNYWDKIVTVVFDGNSASLTGNMPVVMTGADGSVAEGTDISSSLLCNVSGAHVTIDFQTAGLSGVQIVVKGKSTDGSLKIYGAKKSRLVFCGLDLSSQSGPAINIQSHKRVFVHLMEGSVNRLKDADTYSDDKCYISGSSSALEDRKGAFFSEANLIFSGSGVLVADGAYKHGICTDGCMYIRPGVTIAVESAAANCIHVKGDDEDLYGFRMAGGCIYARSASQDGKCLKSDMDIYLDAGIIDLEASGAAGKGIKAGSDTYTTSGITIGTADGGPTISVSTSGSSTGSTSGGSSGGGRPGGWPGSGSTGSSSSSSAKAIKALGKISVVGGNMTVTTNGSGAEGIESKSAGESSIAFLGGKCYVKAYDDAVNSAGQILVDGGYLYAWSTNNDAIDSNYGRSASVSIKGGAVFAHSAAAPECAIDCDNDSYISISGGTLFTSGGAQGGSSGSPTCTVPVIKLSSASLSTGYFTVCDSAGKVLFSSYVPRSISSRYSLISSDDFKSGVSVSYGMTGSSAPSGSSAIWDSWLYGGGTASPSTSVTLSSGLLSK